MKRTVLICIAVSLVIVVFSADTKTSAAERKPLVVLVEYDYNRPVVGSDEPTFALYDDGLVIYWDYRSNYRLQYSFVVLDESERNSLLDLLSIGQAFFELSDFYAGWDYFNLPPNVIDVWTPEGHKAVTCNGHPEGHVRSRQRVSGSV